MSKIQDALNKIRAAEGTALTTEVRPARDIAAPAASRELESQADIHSMKDPVLRSPTELAKLRLLDVQMRDIEVLNAFRELRTTILRSLTSTDSVLLIASTIRGAGASFVTTNLAAAFALDEGKTALVVDCDLRRPSMDAIAVHNGQLRGLRDYLTQEGTDVADIIYPSGVPRLRVLPAGGSEAPLGEYFTSTRLRNLMSELRQRYPERYIFLDAPPVSESADARILADICDYMILVVPYGKTTAAEIDAAIEAVGEDKLLGVVFNNAPRPPKFEW